MINWEKGREARPFIIFSNKIKILGVNLTEQVNDLYDTNFMSLKNKIEKITKDGKISHAYGLMGLKE